MPIVTHAAPERDPSPAPRAAVRPGVFPGTRWRNAGLLLGIVFVAVLVAYWSTFGSIVMTWWGSRTFSHGFLIFPLFLYLTWLRRHRLVSLDPRPAYWTLPILTAAGFVWLLGCMGDVRIVQQFAAVAILDLAIWALLGTAVVRAFWFPLAFLYFAVPFGEGLISPLQDFTAHFAVAALSLSHVPVVLESRLISVPSGPWLVAEACSGIRYLVSSFVLGLVYASLVYRSRIRQILFLLASVVVPIVANGIRAYGIILLSYLTNNRLAAGVDHIVYGWIFFVAVELLLFSVGLRWREGVLGQADGASEKRKEMAAGPNTRAQAIALLAACVLVVVIAAPLSAEYLWKRVRADRRPQTTLVVSAPWQETPTGDQTWPPSLHPDSKLTASYRSPAGQAVDVYLARYSGRRGVELVRSYNQLSGPKIWVDVDGGTKTVTINRRPTKIRWTILRSDFALRLVWTWYSIDGHTTADPTKVKILQLERRLLGQPTTGAVVAIAAPYRVDPLEAEPGLQDFLNHMSVSFLPAPPVQH